MLGECPLLIGHPFYAPTDIRSGSNLYGNLGCSPIHGYKIKVCLVIKVTWHILDFLVGGGVIQIQADRPGEESPRDVIGGNTHEFRI